MKTIRKIVITGGPCGGKSTAMSWIQNAIGAKGYTVLFVPETATEFITGGVAPWTCGTNLDYQKVQMQLQLEKERLFVQAAQSMPNDRILIVCDRGAMDNRAYMTAEEFAEVLAAVSVPDEKALLAGYDAIFHLMTAANGAEEFYTTANNTARIETPAQAIAVDEKLQEAWKEHPKHYVIGNEVEFDEKMRNLIHAILSFLGEPGPYEIERKFLIAYPDLDWLEHHPACTRTEIMQTYLRTNGSDEVRIRQRGNAGDYIYYKTTKRRVNDRKRIEIEERLSKEQYLTLLMDADTSLRQIRKTRYCLDYDGQKFEIDVYPFWQNQAICEIELLHEDQEIRFPPELHVLREVTDDTSFKNSYLARM